MHRLALISLLVVCPGVLALPGGPTQKAGDLYLLGWGVKQDSGRAIDQWNFLPLELERAFREQGKPFYRQLHSRLLLGHNATHKQLMDGLAWLGKNATKSDLVIVFIACFGNCNAQGESVFQTNDGVTVRPRDIKRELAKLPCQAIVVNDACGSGNWPKEFPDDPMPPNVTALCCCLPTQHSETEFDIALFEALYGRADFNKDGIVDLDEVIRYCELRIKEIQGGALTPVMHKARNLRATLPLTKVAPNLVAVAHNGEMWSALLEKQAGEEYYVRVIGWDDTPGPYYMPSKLARSYTLLPTDGPALMVQKDRAWHPACLVGRTVADYKIRYLGPDKTEETVKEERVRHCFAGKPGEAFPMGLFTKNK